MANFSKLAAHVINETPEAMGWAVQCVFWKRLNGSAPITRYYWDEAEQSSRIASMAVEQTFRDIMSLNPINYVEVFNETHQRQGSGLEQHADFMEAIVPLFHNVNLKVAGFSFSTGNPGDKEFHEPDDFIYLASRNFCGCDAIAMHDYWGAPATQTAVFDNAYALRYRLLHQSAPVHPPFFITECGRDAVEGGASGWVPSGLTAEQYIEELLAYNLELMKDKYVWAANVFTGGPTDDWKGFSTDLLDTNKLIITQHILDLSQMYYGGNYAHH